MCVELTLLWVKGTVGEFTRRCRLVVKILNVAASVGKTRTRVSRQDLADFWALVCRQRWLRAITPLERPLARLE